MGNWGGWKPLVRGSLAPHTPSEAEKAQHELTHTHTCLSSLGVSTTLRDADESHLAHEANACGRGQLGDDGLPVLQQE